MNSLRQGQVAGIPHLAAGTRRTIAADRGSNHAWKFSSI